MKAIVIKGFPGCRDGDPVPCDFAEGDVVEGDLAQVAIDQGWALEQGEETVSEPEPEPEPKIEPEPKPAASGAGKARSK